MLDALPTGLLLFVKVPEPGKVKTRLGHAIGFDRSCQLYRCFGRDLLNRLQTLNLPLLIFFAPDHGKDCIQQWLATDTLYPQGEGSLGDRMKHAFEMGFRRGLQHLMIFGSDSPDLPLAFIHQGIESLHAGQTVLGPSNDGGYYTIGFSRQSWCPQAFQNIQWSSERVYPDTLQILRSHSSPVQVLPEWDDIDTLSDLKTLYHRNQTHNNIPQTMSYIEQNLLSFVQKA